MDNMQDLLDQEARAGNTGNIEEQDKIRVIIKLKRGSDAPFCWGHDDCSIGTLVCCPWRIDCTTKGM